MSDIPDMSSESPEAVELIVHLTPADYEAMCHTYKRCTKELRRKMRTTWIWEAIFGVGSSAAFVSYWIEFTSDGPDLVVQLQVHPIIIIVGSILCFSPLIISIYLWSTFPSRMLKALLKAPQGKRMPGRISFKFDQSGIHYESDYSQGLVKWEIISDIQVGCDAAYVVIQDSDWFILPKREFDSIEAFDSAIKSIRGFRTNAPNYEFTCPKCHYDLSGKHSVGCPECGWKREG